MINYYLITVNSKLYEFMKFLIGFIIVILLNSCGIPPNPAFVFNADKTIRDTIEAKKGRNIGPWAYTKKQRDKINE